MASAPQAPKSVAPLGAGHDHAVVDVPFTALIDGRKFRGVGLSLVSAHVTGVLGGFTPGLPRVVRLVFDFDGFAVTLTVLADVRQVADGEIALDFAEPAGAHLPQLRQILNAYIAGDLVALGSVIGIADPKPRVQADGIVAASWTRHFIQGLGTGVVLLALVGVVGVTVYQRTFVTEPMLGTVTQRGETLRATTSGQITFLDTEAAMGQVALTIAAANGNAVDLTMPCDCIANSMGLAMGATVLEGEPVLKLNGVDSTLVVSVAIAPEGAFRLARGDRIEMILPDGTVMAATTQMSGVGPDLLLPARPLAPDMLGLPVKVRLVRDAGWVGRQMAFVRSWFVG